MADQSGLVVAVGKHEGDHIVLSIPLAGFPDGFQLSSGDQVVLIQGDKGLEARPLAHAREVHRAPERKGQTLAADAREFALQDATVNAESPDDRTAIFTVPNEGGRPEQVLSVREPRR
jgi:hypothetical protein